MDIHAIGTARRSRAGIVLVVLGLAIVVWALTIQARSIWSTTTHPLVRPAVVQVDPHPYQADWHRPSSGTAAHRPSLRQIEAKKGR